MDIERRERSLEGEERSLYREEGGCISTKERATNVYNEINFVYSSISGDIATQFFTLKSLQARIRTHAREGTPEKSH